MAATAVNVDDGVGVKYQRSLENVDDGTSSSTGDHADEISMVTSEEEGSESEPASLFRKWIEYGGGGGSVGE